MNGIGGDRTSLPVVGGTVHDRSINETQEFDLAERKVIGNIDIVMINGRPSKVVQVGKNGVPLPFIVIVVPVDSALRLIDT